MLYKISNGSVVLGNKTILETINFEIKNKEHVGIVGRNGCGKTTLLKAIMNEYELEKGLEEDEFRVIKSAISKIGYIKQDAIMDDNITMLDEILKAYDEVLKVEKKLKKIEKELEKGYDERLLNKYQDLYLYYQNIGGFEYKKEYETAIKMFGFSDNDKDKELGDFSYGQRTKIAFLRLLLSKPDLLLLDEPTNHLDVGAIEWLEKYLMNYPKMLVVVSHDRMFLDNVCNIIYEIEYGSLEKYVGNYSYYEKQKKLNYEKSLHDYERQKKEIERLQKIADRFKYKPSKASMAMSKLKQIERMAKIDKPKGADKRTFMTNFSPLEKAYRDVLKVKDLKIGYEEGKALSTVNFNLERGDKLGIIGENGCGKSTLLKTLLGDIPKLGGKYVFGQKVEIGYFDQNVESLNQSDTVLDVMHNEFPSADIVDLRTMLGSFEFYGDMVFQKVSSLSGGQKVKLLLCRVMRHRPNVLILDEPTNHLDIISKETIEELLQQYKGTIIFVSHDRYLIKKLSTKLLIFESGITKYYQGDYKSYLEQKEKEKENIENSNNEVRLKTGNHDKRYVSDFKERSKLERKASKIENEISNIEDKIKKYNEEMLKEEVYLDMIKVKEIQDKILECEEILNDKMNDWESIMSSIEN